jgi:tetrahydromethanopterin S-methyltransferase subunit G
MSKSKQTVIKETEVTEQDSPNVLAYRVGQLEKSQEKGFVELKEQNGSLINKIDLLAHNFASKGDVDAVVKLKEKEHKELDEKIKAVRSELRERVGKVEGWGIWFVRIVGTTVIVAVLSLVVATNTGAV